MQNEKPQEIVLESLKSLERAPESLTDIGFYHSMGENDPEGGHFVLSNNRKIPAIRSVNDDREVLGDIAKQLVIATIPFRLVTAR